MTKVTGWIVGRGSEVSRNGSVEIEDTRFMARIPDHSSVVPDTFVSSASVSIGLDGWFDVQYMPPSGGCLIIEAI